MTAARRCSLPYPCTFLCTMYRRTRCRWSWRLTAFLPDGRPEGKMCINGQKRPHSGTVAGRLTHRFTTAGGRNTAPHRLIKDDVTFAKMHSRRDDWTLQAPQHP